MTNRTITITTDDGRESVVPRLSPTHGPDVADACLPTTRATLRQQAAKARLHS